MHDPNFAHTELYELFDKKTSKLLGICHLDFKVEGKENLEKHLKLTINLKFTYYEDFRIQTAFSSFLASYIHTHNLGPRASISTHNPFEIGGIEIKPSNIAGQRVGGLIFNKIITWLKSFPHATQVNPINYKPTGDHRISKTFYKNFGVPINGGAFTIADLEFHDTWVQNIKQTNLSTLLHKLSLLKIESIELEEKCENLKKQIHRTADIQHTTNLFVAYKSYHVQPNLTVQKHRETPNLKHSELSEEQIIGSYLKTQTEVSEKQETLNGYIQILEEFNEYKRPENKWRNTGNAMKMFVSIYQERCCVALFIFVIFLCFYFSKF